MPYRIIALALLTLRAALRSKLLPALLLLLAAITLGLPAILRGEPAELGAISMTYTLGAAMAVLTTSALWTAAGTIAQDLRRRRLHLLACKPLHRIELWLGPWLGLLLLHGALLLLCGLGAYAQLRWRLAALPLAPPERARLEQTLLASHLRLAPRREDLHAAAVARLQDAETSGWEGAGLPERVGLAILHKALLTERSAVAPGSTRVWTFDLPHHLPADGPPHLRIQLAPSIGPAHPVTGIWTLDTAETGKAPTTLAVTELRHGVNRLPLPAGALTAGTTAILRFTNTRDPQAGSVLFDPERGAEILMESAVMTANLLRALLIMFAQLAAVTALGMAAGAIFSMPVAVFLTSSLVVMALLGHSFTAAPEEAYGIEAETANRGLVLDTLDRFGRGFMEAYSVVTNPLVASNPRPSLAEGILIPFSEVARIALFCLLGYPLLLGGIAAGILARRDLGAP